MIPILLYYNHTSTMRHTLFIGLLGILLAACRSTGRDPIPMTPEFPEEVEIAGTPVGGELIINHPMGIEWRDSNLFLIQPGGCAAKVIRASDASDVAIFGPVGKGPDEFLTPCFIRDEANDSTFTILDVTQRKIARYRTAAVGDSLRFEAVWRGSQPTTRDNLLYTRPIRMRNGFYVAQIVAGENTGNKGLVLLDSAWQVVRTFCDPLPEGGNEKSHFQGPLVSKGDTLFYAGITMPYIAAFKISDNGEITTLWEQFITRPLYQVEADGFVRWTKDKHQEGLCDLRLTGNHLIAAYSGKPRNLDTPIWEETLLVFDLDGHPIKKIRLPKLYGRFALTPDGKTMYGFNSPEIQIMRYDLSSVL